jgi:hypothetical protein
VIIEPTTQCPSGLPRNAVGNAAQLNSGLQKCSLGDRSCSSHPCVARSTSANLYELASTGVVVRKLGFFMSLWTALTAGTAKASEQPHIVPSDASLVSQAARYEDEVRAEFRSSNRQPAASDMELLVWMDEQTQTASGLGSDARDDLAQRYGATLGQVVIKKFGGTWVRADSPQGPADGVLLTNGKVAFVFNRAARRVFDGDPIGFVSFTTRASKECLQQRHPYRGPSSERLYELVG